jgi:hypothetical protein
VRDSLSTDLRQASGRRPADDRHTQTHTHTH